MNRETILVVDDNPENLMLLELLLDYEGFKVQTADSANEALKALSNSLPGVMLTDIQMPEVDGLELIRRVRMEARTRELPILAVSANAMKENIQEAYAAGCDGYLTKPIDTPTLAAAVREQLEHGRKRGDTQGSPVAQPEQAKLRNGEFLMTCAQQIEQLLSPVRGVLFREQASGILHDCAGTAGALGYPQIATLARDLNARSGILNEQEFTSGLRRLSDLLTYGHLQATKQVN
ncbi:MAG: response regulator [Acidobacteriota bacterium]